MGSSRDWSFPGSVPLLPGTGLTFFSVLRRSLCLVLSLLYSFHPIPPSAFPLRAVFTPLLCSTFTTTFQLTCQSPYPVPDTRPSTLEVLIHSYSPQKAYEASLGFILILQTREHVTLFTPGHTASRKQSQHPRLSSLALQPIRRPFAAAASLCLSTRRYSYPSVPRHRFFDSHWSLLHPIFLTEVQTVQSRIPATGFEGKNFQRIHPSWN